MEIVTEPDIRTGRAGAALRRGAPAAAPLDRRVGRRHGARPDAGRGQRLAPAARHRAVRDPGRGQEHELVPLGRAGDRASRSSARRRPSTPGEPLRPGDPRLVRRARRDVPHADQGDLRRLPLLPRAGPAAAARRSGLARRDPGRPARAAGRAPGALPARPRAVAPTTPRVLVADPTRRALFEATLGRRRRRSSQGRSRTGSPASTCGCATRRPTAASTGRRGASSPAIIRRGRRRIDLAGATARRSSPSTASSGAPVGAIIDDARASARSRTPARSRRPSTRCSRRTRRPSPTTGPARPRRSASSSARS